MELRRLGNQANDMVQAVNTPQQQPHSVDFEEIEIVVIFSAKAMAFSPRQTAFVDRHSPCNTITLQKLFNILGSQVPYVEAGSDNQHQHHGFVGTKLLQLESADFGNSREILFCILENADHPIVLNESLKPTRSWPTLLPIGRSVSRKKGTTPTSFLAHQIEPSHTGLSQHEQAYPSAEIKSSVAADRSAAPLFESHPIRFHSVSTKSMEQVPNSTASSGHGSLIQADGYSPLMPHDQESSMRSSSLKTPHDASLLHVASASSSTMTLGTITSTHTQLEFQNWSELKPDEKLTCIGTNTCSIKYGGMTAWGAAGCLLKKWNDTIFRRLRDIFDGEENQRQLRGRLTKAKKYSPVPLLYMLNPAGIRERAVPYIIFLHQRRGIARNAVKIVQEDRVMAAYGFRYLPDISRVSGEVSKPPAQFYSHHEGLSLPQSGDAVYDMRPVDFETEQAIPSNGLRTAIHKEPTFTDSGYGSIPNLNHLFSVRDPPSESQDPSPSIPSRVVDGQVGVDANTQYSAATTVAPAEVQDHIVALCNNICDKLVHDIDAEGWSSLCRALPRLIKAFAIMIGYESTASVNQEIMYFIHSRHREIATKLQATFQSQEDADSVSGRELTGSMSLSDKMRMWQSKANSNPGHDDLFIGIKDLEEETNELADLALYNRTILDSAAYKWLVARLQKESVLQWRETQPCTLIEDIRRTILNELRTGTISKRRAPCAYEVKFDLEWHSELEQRLPHKIFEPSNEPAASTSEWITVTGRPEEAQALTIAQYLDQTWPVKGLQLLNAIQNSVTSCGRHYSVTSPDSTRLEARIDHPRLTITATGPAYFIAECGEQLAWLGAALRSNNRLPVSAFTPAITSYSVRQSTSDSTKVKYHGRFEIRFEIASMESNYWQGLPGESNLVPGFPIARRPEGYLGLEFSYEVLLRLLGADRASVHSGSIFVQGRRTNIWLMRYTGNIYAWHPLHNPTEICSVHLNSHSENCSSSFDLRNLDIGRHILSNCPEVQNLTAGHTSVNPTPKTPGISETKTVHVQETASVGGLENSRHPKLSQRNEDHRSDREHHQHETLAKTSIIEAVLDPATTNPTRVQRQAESYPSANSHLLPTCQSIPDSTLESSDESLESDLLSLTDSSRRSEHLDPLDGWVYEVINTVLHRLLSEFRGNIRDHLGPNEHQGASTYPTRAAESSEARKTSGKCRKRSRGQEGNGDDDHDDIGDDDPFQPPLKRSTLSQERPLLKSLACPFLKLDPVKHRGCCANKHSRIRDVKQHLSRRHTPPRYCQRCLETSFKDEQSLQRHVDSGTCLAMHPTFLEGISYEQRGRLSRKSKAGLTEEQQWFAIWELLFPAHPAPNSAYLDGDLSLEMREFREYCLFRGPALLREQIQLDPGWQSQELTTEQQQIVLERLIAQGIISIIDSWQLTVADSFPANQAASNSSMLGNNLRSIQYQTSSSSIADSGVVLRSQFSPGETTYHRGELSQSLFDSDHGFQPAKLATSMGHHPTLQDNPGTVILDDGQNPVDGADFGYAPQEGLEDFSNWSPPSIDFTNGRDEIIAQHAEDFDTAALLFLSGEHDT